MQSPVHLIHNCVIIMSLYPLSSLFLSPLNQIIRGC